MNSGV